MLCFYHLYLFSILEYIQIYTLTYMEPEVKLGSKYIFFQLFAFK